MHIYKLDKNLWVGAVLSLSVLPELHQVYLIMLQSHLFVQHNLFLTLQMYSTLFGTHLQHRPNIRNHC